MSLFSRPQPQPNPACTERVKTWVRGTPALPASVPISMSQLRCGEPGCPPVETAIAVMVEPVRTLKIHKAPVVEVTAADITAASETP